mmetsp:Transcript_6500/g.7217  ORF Transcript_6500/g.7217 Transcript_6500/m.7217 type:complete len:177 (+) Transcript_6500:55-585(+)|eukprot:CAMPEP_0170906230 /NCGR_PEP_ID=MMETSP0735-20130129/559_1 /TAXON_ID=186038 /ORGANISM="Fragilariopsis kerguelensis, Strain L26-C5" /LENGTH=176 /DNA_ID=CAMNT_0011302069 /DNA_START=36 /DNA_END=566 /DNA_ORIENTATION=+
MEQFKKQESCKPYFEDSYGYAVFESITKAGIFFVGGATGTGTVFVAGKDGVEARKIGTSTMMQASLGPQFGGQVYSMIIFFNTEQDCEKFKTDNFEFGADANVVALTASVGAKINTVDDNIDVQGGVSGTDHSYGIRQPCSLLYSKGMAIFTNTTGGLMYEASLSGQKYNYVASSE